jgi:hypothetical protein
MRSIARTEKSPNPRCGSGNKQEESVHYFETFASAAKHNMIRIVLALAEIWRWGIDQIEVVSAYLNSELKDEVYMAEEA